MNARESVHWLGQALRGATPVLAVYAIVFTLSAPGAVACQGCSATLDCESSTEGRCVCSSTTRVFADGALKICRESGALCNEVMGCDGNVPEEIDVDTLSAAWQPAASMANVVLTALASEARVAATLLSALVDQEQLLISSGEGALQFLDHDRDVIRAYRYEFTTAREPSGIAIKVLYGDIDGPMTSFISGTTFKDGQAGSLRISDGVERTLSWDLRRSSKHERFTWSR